MRTFESRNIRPINRYAPQLCKTGLDVTPMKRSKRYVSTIRYPNRELSPFASRWTASVIQEAGRYRSPFCNDRPALGPVDSCTTLDLMNRPTEVGGIRRTCHQFINLSLETPFPTSHIMLVL